jgi:putative transposase
MWRSRFAERRMDRLYDEQHPTASREIAEAVRKTLEARPKGRTDLSSRAMAKVIANAPSTMQRICPSMEIVHRRCLDRLGIW